MMTHIVRDSGLACSRNSVERHVAWDVSFQCLPQIVGYFLDLVFPVREVIRPVVVAKMFFVLEEGFLGNEFVKDVGFHQNSPPYLYH